MKQRVGLLFPGQGAQYVGMGKDLAEEYAGARRIFREADDILGFSISRLCFEGPDEKLTLTENAQPGIFVASMAALEVFREVRASAVDVSAVCGLSAGEYSALVAAGSIDFSQALKLVRRRGELMADAARGTRGTMASVLGISLETCREICRESGAELANINSPEQIVISGRPEHVERASELAKAAGAKRVIPLKVSGAFHSSLMKPAQKSLGVALRTASIRSPQSSIAFIANVSGAKVRDADEIREGLLRQIIAPVEWMKCMQSMSTYEVTIAYEVGPGKVLKGLSSRIKPEVSVTSWGTLKDVEEGSNHHTVSSAG